VASLCLSCVLCCTHGLFRNAPVKAAEVDRLKTRRLPMVNEGNQWRIQFPCTAHNGRCSIYPDRPEACRKYECDILRAVNDGSMPEPSARALLDRANVLVAGVRAKLPGNGDLWTDVRRYCEDSAQWRGKHADLLLELFELRKLLQRVDHNHGS